MPFKVFHMVAFQIPIQKSITLDEIMQCLGKIAWWNESFHNMKITWDRQKSPVYPRTLRTLHDLWKVF